MSIDLIDGASSDRKPKFDRAAVERALSRPIKTPITNMVIVFGGWGASDAGQPLDYEKGGTGAEQLAKRVSGLTSTSGYETKVLAYQGAFQGGASDALLTKIVESFHPLGKLIVYGYSAGGLTALQLSYRLGIILPYYDTRTKGLSRYFPAQNKREAGVVYGYLRIDLLVTIDIASGPQSSFTPRRVWPSVRRNLNIYQTHPSPAFSHGGPTEAVEHTVTDVTAQKNWTSKYDNNPSKGHGMIDNDSLDDAVTEISDELSR